MKKSWKTKWLTRRNRLKRRSGNIFREVFKVFFLLSAILTITMIMIFGYNYTISSPYFQIRETAVRGCKELTEKDILLLAAIKPAQNILTVNMNTITRRISTNPWVRDVSIGRELPDRLVIEVRERTPVALIQGDSGFYLMDLDGVAFKRLEAGDEADLPVLTGCASGKKTNPELIKKSLKLLRYLATSRDFPTIDRISEVHGSEISGLSLFTNDGMSLQLGFDSYENKLKRLIPVMADLTRKNLRGGFLRIDLSDPVKITVQRRNIAGSIKPVRAEKQYRTL
ncbi:MAG: FtsQ-type POTRA domain-containing protein [Syntrophales bacterium]|nr:FtsQ-type POTRA domain-containing protein [Syntrophales bacterium]